MDHARICTRFKLAGRRTHVKMPGGFIVVASYNRLFESPTELSAGQFEHFGSNAFVRRQFGRGIMAELLLETAVAARCDWRIDPGNEHCPNLWDIKMKPICGTTTFPACSKRGCT